MSKKHQEIEGSEANFLQKLNALSGQAVMGGMAWLALNAQLRNMRPDHDAQAARLAQAIGKQEQGRVAEIRFDGGGRRGVPRNDAPVRPEALEDKAFAQIKEILAGRGGG